MTLRRGRSDSMPCEPVGLRSGRQRFDSVAITPEEKGRTVNITGSTKKAGGALGIAMMLFLGAAGNARAAQEPLRDRTIVPGYGRSDVTILGEVLPGRDGSPFPPRLWVVLRGVFGYEERQLVERHRRFYFANVPRARLILVVEAEGHEPARFDINPNEDDTYVEVTPGPRLRSVPQPFPSGPRTVDTRTLKIPAKAVRELRAAARHLRTGELDQALRRLQKATEFHPNYDVAYNDMGVIYLKLGRHREAGVAFSKAVEINPDLGASQANLGLYHLITAQREQAVEHLSRAVALDPSKLRTQVFLGEALCGVGRCTEAEQVLKQVISLDPALSLAYRRLGYVYLELKRYAEALGMFRQFMNRPQGEATADVEKLLSQLEQSFR